MGALKPVIAWFGNRVGRILSRTTRWHKKQPWLSAKRFGVSPRRKAGASSFWSASPDPTVSAHGNHVPFKVSLSGARYLFHIFDMTYSMAVEIQPNGIDTPGGRYGTFSSDLAPTTEPPPPKQDA